VGTCFSLSDPTPGFGGGKGGEERGTMGEDTVVSRRKNASGVSRKEPADSANQLLLYTSLDAVRPPLSRKNGAPEALVPEIYKRLERMGPRSLTFPGVVLRDSKKARKAHLGDKKKKLLLGSLKSA